MSKNHSEGAAQNTTVMPTHQRLCMVGSMALAIGLSILFYMHSLSFPSCCDASQYVEMARHFEAHGFGANAPHSDVRTFGYPFLLWLVSSVAVAIGVPFPAAVFVVQLSMYVACVVLLYFRFLRLFGPAAGLAVYYGLTFNVLLFPYLPLTMTDGMSVILFLCAAGVLVSLAAGNGLRMTILCAAVLGFLVGFAVIVRPANLWLCALVVIGALLVYRKRGRARQQAAGARTTRDVVMFIAIAGITGIVATVPQSALNWMRAHKATPLPIYDLKAKQLDAGVRYIKYGTNMTGERPAGLFYRNPLFVEAEGRQGIDWYFRAPLRGSMTLVLRMFAGFDFDYLFPYIYDLRPGYRPVLFLLSQFIVFFGIGAIILLMYPTLARRILGTSAAEHFYWTGPIPAGQVFITALLGWAAIHAVSAIENRFTLPMVTMLMPLAVAALWVLIRVFQSGNIKRGLWIVAGFGLWMAACLPIIRILERAKQLPFS